MRRNINININWDYDSSMFYYAYIYIYFKEVILRVYFNLYYSNINYVYGKNICEKYDWTTISSFLLIF